jgi:hypothetical protein
MSNVEQDIEAVMELANKLAGPRNMGQAEAIEFYEAIAEQCQEWASQIRSEIAREST